MIAQTVKRYSRRRVKEVVQRVVRGTEEALQARLNSTQGGEGAQINTSYAERLQATFRSRLAPLARKTRSAVRRRATLEAGMWSIGTAYNFCCWHRSLRLPRSGANAEGRWIERTPAQAAAGLTDHRWTFHELLVLAVPPAIPKRRGRRPKWLLEAAHAA
jgi:hypothetical protein